MNLLWCRPGQVGGAEEYLTRQLAGLAVAAPDVTTRLFVPPGFVTAHPELADSFDIVQGPVASSTVPGRMVEEMRWLPQRIKGASVIHHGGGTVPLRSPGPIVLTIHDLQYRQYPQYFSAAKRNYLRLAMPGSVRRTSIIAVPSEYVRLTVLEAFDAPPDRVVVVPHGVPRGEPSVDEAELRNRFGLGARRVLVYPAATYPHKRHRLLIELLAGPLAGEDFVLLLLGGRGRADEAITEAIRTHGVGDRVVRPGRVPDADRDALIAIAEALVFPSEYEGFGAPVLEAMALGTPVICSDRTALPEVAGDAAMVVPLELEAWARAIQRLPAERAGLIEHGHQRASRFSLEASGAALAAAYRAAARSVD